MHTEMIYIKGLGHLRLTEDIPLATDNYKPMQF